MPSLADYRTRRQLNLVQAVDAKLIDPRAKTVHLSPEKTVSVQKAVEEGALSREVGEQLRRVDKMTFAEAVSKGLIDVAQDTFTDAESGKQISIKDAVRQGLIDTGTVQGPDSDGTERTNLARILQSDEFDERSGRVQVRNLHPQLESVVHPFRTHKLGSISRLVQLSTSDWLTRTRCCTTWTPLRR